MDFGDDSNPFADTTVRQATASNYSNPQTNANNPFANTTTPAKPASPPKQTPAAVFLPSPQPPTFQPSVPAPVPTPAPVQQPAATRVDLTEFERRQAELEAREKRIAERERAIINQEGALKSDNNFPPLPKFCPCRPCFYQDISVEIPSEFQLWVRYLYYLWLFYSFTLFLNMIAALSYFLVDPGDGAVSFGLSLFYLVLFIPASYIFWFRPIYRAFRTDSSVYFMIFFFIDALFIGTNVLFAIGIVGGMCGFLRVSTMSQNKVVGSMMAILGCLWSLICIAAVIATIRVHRLYRKTGASLEQAQKEFKTAFVNNPTVRGAAREVATAGINEALRSDGDHRPIY